MVPALPPLSRSYSEKRDMYSISWWAFSCTIGLHHLRADGTMTKEIINSETVSVKIIIEFVFDSFQSSLISTLLCIESSNVVKFFVKCVLNPVLLTKD
jgi:hypothetical protein